MWSLILIAVLLLAVNGFVFSQDQTDEELKIKYKAIITPNVVLWSNRWDWKYLDLRLEGNLTPSL